jgi:hypothetical protein
MLSWMALPQAATNFGPTLALVPLSQIFDPQLWPEMTSIPFGSGAKVIRDNDTHKFTYFTGNTILIAMNVLLVSASVTKIKRRN